jgi:hypothetical protein
MKPVDGVEVAAEPAIQTLWPHGAAVLVRPFELSEQRARAAPEERRPAFAPLALMQKQRGQERARRAPHQLACRVIFVGGDGRGDRRRAVLQPAARTLHEQDGRVSEKPRWPVRGIIAQLCRLRASSSSRNPP